MSTVPRIGRPWNQRRRRKIACSRRNAMGQRVYASSFWSIWDQSSQETSLSWQYALLLPFWDLPSSSPPRSIGTPWDRKRVVRKLRCWVARHVSTALLTLSPSAPQFQERLCDSPSALFSPFASLCFSL